MKVRQLEMVNGAHRVKIGHIEYLRCVDGTPEVSDSVLRGNASNKVRMNLMRNLPEDAFRLMGREIPVKTGWYIRKIYWRDFCRLMRAEISSRMVCKPPIPPRNWAPKSSLLQASVRSVTPNTDGSSEIKTEVVATRLSGELQVANLRIKAMESEIALLRNFIVNSGHQAPTSA